MYLKQERDHGTPARTSAETVSLNIDGYDVSVPKGTSVMRAAVEAGIQAMLKGGTPVVADVEMICSGLSQPRLGHFGIKTHQFISDADVIETAKAEDTTRAVQAMRKAHRKGLLNGAIIGIGNAPTALIELVRLIREEGAKPALVVGMPVGFVAAAETLEAPAACRGELLRVLVHHADDLARALGDGIVGRFRFQEIEPTRWRS